MGKCSEITTHVLRRNCWVNSVHFNMVDLSAAISSQQQAIHLTPQERTKPTELVNFGDLYLQRWERTGNKADISEAILCMEKAVNLTPEDLNMPTWLNTLGKFYASRFECTGNLADLSEAIASSENPFRSLRREILKCTSGWITSHCHITLASKRHTIWPTSLKQFLYERRPSD